MDKIITYINFSKANRTIIYGQNTIEKTKNVQVILYDNLSQSTIDRLKLTCKDIYKIDKQYFDKLIISASVIAITDKSLATAIINELNRIGGK